MTPRIPVAYLGLDRHGTPDARSLEPPTLHDAGVRYDIAVQALGAIDAVTTELVRIRNAHVQQCNL
jgi:hypothetical protein